MDTNKRSEGLIEVSSVTSPLPIELAVCLLSRIALKIVKIGNRTTIGNSLHPNRKIYRTPERLSTERLTQIHGNLGKRKVATGTVGLHRQEDTP